MNIINTTKKILPFAVCAIFIFVFTVFVSAAAEDSDVLGKEVKNLATKYIALTFDDGPHPVYTQKILDILEEKKIPATFFVAGFRAELIPGNLKRMKQLNCEIGNHTYNHADLVNATNNKTVFEIEKCSEAIFAATGEYPLLYRPPFGKIRNDNADCIPLRKILWTIDSLDWNAKSKDKVVKNIVKNAKNGSIVLMHDFYESTVSALPEIIDILTEKGFEFVTVSELLDLQKT